MSLAVTFSLSSELKAQLSEMKQNDAIRAVICVIESETMVPLGNPIPATVNLEDDLSAVRKTLMERSVPACFVVVKPESTKYSLLLFTPEGIKPKLKMMYASSAAHLRNESHLPIGADTHIGSVAEISAALYGRNVAKDREEMLTDSEKLKKELEALPVAPQAQNLPGVHTEIEKKDELLGEFLDGTAKALLFQVTPKSVIEKDKSFSPSTATSDIIAALPTTAPRFLLISWDGKPVLVYVCPESCKPKERMNYAASKASFVAQIKKAGVKLEKSVETDSPASVESSVTEALTAAPLQEEAKPIAPKPSAQKGFKMLMK